MSPFETLYREQVARVHTLARRLLGSSQADDATQEVFMRAWSRLDGWRGEGEMSAWLYRLALNVLLNERERKGREPATEVADPPAPNRSLGDAADLDAAIEGLPAGAREVFVLHDVEGFRHDEIALRLGLSPGTSKSQLHRARMLLRRALEDHHG